MSEGATGIGSPEKRLPRETAPEESPDSREDIVLMCMRPIRPVPVCESSGRSAGTADPVSTNCPVDPRVSTSKRTASQSCGASCHSSMRRGASPASSVWGEISASRMFCERVAGFCM